MDFKSLLQSFDTLSEAETKDTKTGRVHKGDYGTSYDAGEEGTTKSADAPKKGRGRPKKGADDSGEVKSYDTKSLGNVFGGGAKPSKSVGTVSKKHSLKEYIESTEQQKKFESVKEDIVPTDGTQQGQQQANADQKMKSNSMNAINKLANAGIKIQNKTQAADTATKTATNPGAKLTPQEKGIDLSLAGQINTLLAKGTSAQVDQLSNLVRQMEKSSGNSVNESKDEGKPGKNFAKIAKSAAKEYGSKAAGERVAGAVRAKLMKQGKLEESAEEKSYTCVHAKKGKCEVTATTSYDAAKKAAAKWKLNSTSGIDAHLNTTKVAVDEAAKPDFLDMDKDGNKKESFKKAVNDKKSKKKVAESRIHEDSDYTYETVAKVLAREKPGLNTSSDDFASAVYHELVAIGMTPKSAHNMLSYNEDFLSNVASSYEHYQSNPSLDEGATEDFAQKAPEVKPSKMVQVPAKQEPTQWSVDPINAATDRAYNFISSLKKPSLFKEGTDMKDIQMESWEKQLSSLLNEGITVSTSTGQQGAPDSVSINATDADAEQLLSVLRSAGVGVFGGNEKPEIGYGVAQGGEEEADGTGTEPEMSPEVVGDGDDMLALIKKMSGIGGEQPQAQNSEDYQDEESSEAGTLEPASADDEESDDEEQDSGEESDDEEEQTDEGNAFTGKLKDTPKGEEFKLGDKEYKDTSSIEENEEMCDECGMMECECDHGEEEQVTEWANDAGGDASADTELMKLKALLSVGNDLHKMKTSQAMGNPVRVTESKQMINEWKKLSGI